jgi:NTE family protein
MKSNRPKIGLALGSGGARGLAHIGVIKILEKNNIPIDFIAGSSIGALIGGLYAATKNIKKIEEIFLANNKQQLLKLAFDPTFGPGFINGDKIENFVSNIIDEIKFKNLKIPFTAVATDLKNGKSVLIDKGSVSNAIRSSISVPMIFKPSQMGKKLLVDGGLSQSVPVEAVKKMGADFVIAVNLDAHCHYQSRKKNLSLSDIGYYSLGILRARVSELNAKNADVIIEPDIHNSSIIGWMDFTDGKKLIKKGESATKSSIIKIKNKNK